MTDDGLEDRLRTTLHEMADAAPLVNPDQPRSGEHPPTKRGGLRVDIKVVTVVVGTLIVLTTIITVGLTSGTSPSHAPQSSTTSSSTPTGPIVVPNAVGLTPAQAAGVLQRVGMTNSIDNVNCGSSIVAGHVVTQTPSAGSHVAPGSRISLRVACP